jgi:hypothetical protein
VVRLTIIAASFFAAGFFSALILFAILRDRLIDDAIASRERALYASTLQRVRDLPPAGQPADISLAEFEVPSRHRDGRR